MTQLNYTKNLLNIKDQNVNLYENFLEIKNIKGIETKIIHCYLSYEVHISLFVNKKNVLSSGIGNEIVWLKSLKLLITILLFYLINKDLNVKIVITLLLPLLL